MKFEIVDIDFDHTSFNWGNGRYIIIGKHQNDDSQIEICRFRNGTPELYDDGTFSVSVTGKNNPGITKTGMFYYGDREKKLKRILKIKS